MARTWRYQLSTSKLVLTLLVLALFNICFIFCTDGKGSSDGGNTNTKSDEFAEFDQEEEESEPEDDSDFVDINTDPGTPPNAPREEPEEEDQEESSEDAFDPYADEEEFEGYNKDRSAKTKSPGPDLKITKVPVHLRTGWQGFYMEIVTILGLLVYAANFFTGKAKNSKLATSWFKAHKPLLEVNFSIVGDDGMSKEPQSGVLVKESESVYTLWCTGRQYCEGMLVELKLLKRHDLVNVISNLIKPKSELVTITVYMDDEDMDSFVFAILPKKTAPKLQKDLQDLNFFCSEKKAGEKFGLPNSYMVVSENMEAAQHILTAQISKVISGYEDCFESMHFSDQYVGPKKEESEEEVQTKLKKPKKVLMFQFKVPGLGRTKAQHMAATEPLMKMVLFLIDRVKYFKLSRDAKTKAEKRRREVEDNFLKSSHAVRQEAAMARREEKRRAEKEKMMAEEDPDKQRRLEEKQLKKELKNRGPKKKSLKVRM